MSRIRLIAVAAIACVALAVPAAASAKDEAATAAAIGNPVPLQVNDLSGLYETKDEAATAAAIGDPVPAGNPVGTIGNPVPLQVNLPPESAWSFCANEGSHCEFTGTKQVRYGTPGSFLLPREFTNGLTCDNGTFGVDPAPGVVKRCEIVR
jgi:hypothetical protein